MAPPRRALAPGETRIVHLRLPGDVFDRIDARAKSEGRPFNRIIINELAAHPRLAAQAELGETVREMQSILAKYSWHLNSVTLNEDFLRAFDAALEAQTEGQRQMQLDRARVARGAMLEGERQVAQTERDQLAARIKGIERLIGAFAALPASAIERDDLPSARAELTRLRQADQGATVAPKPKSERARKR